jgi:hypothetical protein
LTTDDFSFLSLFICQSSADLSQGRASSLTRHAMLQCNMDARTVFTGAKACGFRRRNGVHAFSTAPGEPLFSGAYRPLFKWLFDPENRFT